MTSAVITRQGVVNTKPLLGRPLGGAECDPGGRQVDPRSLQPKDLRLPHAGVERDRHDRPEVEGSARSGRRLATPRSTATGPHREPAANGRLLRLAAVDAGVFPPRFDWHCVDCPVWSCC
jgi:hypothetical protein